MTFWPILGLVAGAIALALLVAAALLPMHRGMKWPWVSRKDYDAIVDALRAAQSERYFAVAKAAEEVRRGNRHEARVTELTAELEAEKQRARRRTRRNGSSPLPTRHVPGGQNENTLTGVRGMREPVVDMRDATAATDEPKVAALSPAVSKAIREVAGRDAPMSRHLRAFAEDQREIGVSEREIIRMIRQGEQVAL